MARRRKNNPKNLALTLIIAIGLGIAGFYGTKEEIPHIPSYQLEEVPTYAGSSYVVLNNNEPTFTAND